jgi:hypothetical protein
MLNQRLTAARSVAEDLFKFEAAVDDAISLGSQLSSCLMTARRDAKLSAVIGQDALDGVIRTLSTIVAARRELIEAHHQLKTVADEIGLRSVAFGDNLKPPAISAPAENKLKAVA